MQLLYQRRDRLCKRQINIIRRLRVNVDAPAADCIQFLSKTQVNFQTKTSCEAIWVGGGKAQLRGQTACALWFSRSPFVFPCSTVRCRERKKRWRERWAVEGEKAKAGITAQVRTPYCGLTCLPAYSAFFSDNTGSETVRKHEMFPHTCWQISEWLDAEEPPCQRLSASIMLFK